MLKKYGISFKLKQLIYDALGIHYQGREIVDARNYR